MNDEKSELAHSRNDMLCIHLDVSTLCELYTIASLRANLHVFIHYWVV